MPRKPDETVLTNRKARHDYLILDTWECGIVLHGAEDMLAFCSTVQKQIALVGSSGCGMHKADVQSAY